MLSNITIKNPESLLDLGSTIVNLIPPLEDMDADELLEKLTYVVHKVGRQGKKLPLYKKFPDGNYEEVSYNKSKVNGFIDIRKPRYVITNTPKGFIPVEDCEVIDDGDTPHGKLMCMRRLRAHTALLIVLNKEDHDLRQVFGFPISEFLPKEIEMIVKVSDAFTKRIRKTKDKSTMQMTLGSEILNMYEMLNFTKYDSEFWDMKHKEKTFILQKIVEAHLSNKKISEMNKAVFLIAY